MAKKDNLGLLLLAVGAFLIVSRRAKAEPEPSVPIEIKFYNSEGRLVESNSPANLSEGESYTAVVTVTNQSTRGGELIEARLSGYIFGEIMEPSYYFLLEGSFDETFGPGGTKSFSYPFSVPEGFGGSTGRAYATVYSPAELLIGRVEEPLVITGVVTTWAAGIGIGF